MTIRPVTLRAANAFIKATHRHHGVTRGHRFSLGLFREGVLVAVACVGRPVARGFDFDVVAEVTRLASDGTPNACSMLYAASARACKAMGYRSIITYLLESENGASLKASGWKVDGQVPGRSWSCESRPRTDKHPTVNKTRWTLELNP